jgi:iron uptake system EfeUOB component EfeO/EfeM
MNRNQTSIAALLAAVVVLASAAARADAIDDGMKAYKSFVAEHAKKALAGAKALQAAVKKGDVKAAQAAWIESRKGWEANEPVIGEFFGDLDAPTDAWPDAKSGYHAIEARLFAGKLEGLEPMIDKVIVNLGKMDKQLNAKDFKFTAQGLLNGTANLAYEVGEDKSKGGESPFAGTSHIDMQENVEGIEASYELVFRPTLAKKNPEIAEKIHEAIEKLEMLVKVPNIKSLDEAAVHRTGEELAALFVTAAPDLGLKQPELEGEEGEGEKK